MTRASPARAARKQTIAHCHWRIKKTAQALCTESYELVMSKNEVYELWKRQNPGLVGEALRERYVARNWAKYVEGARATLTRLLTEPIDQALKDEIEEALILDATLMRGRRNPQVVLGQAK